jgi:DNA-binding YbaB/EbfC family protein
MMNFQNMMSQAQKMQKALDQKMAEYEKKKFAYDYKNGAIIITSQGDYTIANCQINKDLIDPNEPNILQEMICEAINQALLGVKNDRDEIKNSLIPH